MLFDFRRTASFTPYLILVVRSFQWIQSWWSEHRTAESAVYLCDLSSPPPFFLHQYMPNSEVSLIHIQIHSISVFSYKMRWFWDMKNNCFKWSLRCTWRVSRRYMHIHLLLQLDLPVYSLAQNIGPISKIT